MGTRETDEGVSRLFHHGGDQERPPPLGIESQWKWKGSPRDREDWSASRKVVHLIAVVTALSFLSAVPDSVQGAQGEDFLWIDVFGSVSIPGAVDDLAHGLAVDPFDRFLYVAGTFGRELPGEVSFGGNDGFLRKYDPDGKEIWTAIFGTSANDGVADVVVDLSGVYLAGYTEGALPGQTNKGGRDGFVLKYDREGTLDWIHQFGDEHDNEANSLAVDSSGVYVGGSFFGDDFVAKFNHRGDELWIQRVPGLGFIVRSVAVDVSGVYVGGRSPGENAFLRRYDTDGNFVWMRLFGTQGLADSVTAIAAHPAGIFVTGFMGAPNAFDNVFSNAFVRKYDRDGFAEWERVFGSEAHDVASSLALDTSGVYVAGWTEGTGQREAFVRVYDYAGNLGGTRQFTVGAALRGVEGLGVDASGVYVVGSAEPKPGWTRDAFVVKIGNLAPPSVCFTFSPLNPVAGHEVMFDASCSLDQDGDPLEYRWDFGDGSNATERSPTHTYAASGDYPVRLRVSAGTFVHWTRQYPSDDQAAAFGVSLHDSGVYVAGWRTGAGLSDASVSKFTSAGSEVWVRQIGSSGQDTAYDVFADASGVYAVGQAGGALPTQSFLGVFDAFVVKYDIAGNRLWIRQFGTNGWDRALGVAADSSGVYVVYEQDRLDFVRKYDLDGNVVWTRQFSVYILGYGVAVDDSGVYVIGTAVGGGAYVRKYDVDGNELWTHVYGASSAGAMDVAVDGRFVYVTGFTGREGIADGPDSLLVKLDHAGNELWSRQFGTPDRDGAWGVTVDSSGIYVAGHTSVSSLSITWDGFVQKYGADGSSLWFRRISTPQFDAAYDVAVDNSGIYVVGETGGTLPGQTRSTPDGYPQAFARKYDREGKVGSVTQVVTVAPRMLIVDLTGEFDYARAEPIRVKMSALVLDAVDFQPVSGAFVLIRVYDDDGRYLMIMEMVEVLTGVYEWRSTDTIGRLRLEKGIYRVYVTASWSDGPVAHAIEDFHIDPPGEDSGSDTPTWTLGHTWAAGLGALGGMGLVLLALRILKKVRQEKGTQTSERRMGSGRGRNAS